jgi:hypothetical protein
MPDRSPCRLDSTQLDTSISSTATLNFFASHHIHRACIIHSYAKMAESISGSPCSNEEALASRRGILVSCRDESIDMLKKNDSDDQSAVTLPTVSCFVSEDDDTDSSCNGSHSVASFSTVGLPCVFFSNIPQIKEIPNRLDYTDEELDACWYGRREKEVMRDAALGIAESLGYHYFQDEYGQPTSTTFRGLESYTVKGSEQRKLQRLKNLVAVLREQRRQRSCGEVVTNGPEFIEAACRSVSSQCSKRAYLQGIQDERDALSNDCKPTSGLDHSPKVLLQLTQLFRDLGRSNPAG